MKLTRISKKVARFLRLNPFEKRTTNKVSISDYTLTFVPVVSTSLPSFTSWSRLVNSFILKCSPFFRVKVPT